MGADVAGVAGVDVLPGGAHTRDFLLVIKLGEKNIGKLLRCGARKDAGYIHMRIPCASKAKINDTDHFAPGGGYD